MGAATLSLHARVFVRTGSSRPAAVNAWCSEGRRPRGGLQATAREYNLAVMALAVASLIGTEFTTRPQLSGDVRSAMNHRQ